jgi:N4-gp56 family major capsid protein
MSAQVTTGLTQEMSVYYEGTFLDRAEYEYIFNEAGQMRSMPANEGKQINFTRHTPLATVTTALTEGSNPAENALTATTVSAQLAEYGTTVKISRFLSLTSIDQNNEEKIGVVGQNMGETIDELTRNELATGGTAQLAGAKAALTDVGTTDVMSVDEIRKAVRNLKKAKAKRFQSKNGGWVAKLGPDTSYDMTKDNVYINSDIYDNGSERLYNGELGKIVGARLIESPNQKETVDGGNSSADIIWSFVHGQNAFGCIDLTGDKPDVFIIPNNKIDSGNAAGRFSLVSWAGSYVCKTLNSAWLIAVKSGATQRT